MKKAKTFLDDEYLRDLTCASDDQYFYFKCLCYHSFKKNEPPHKLQVALCLVRGVVKYASCTCVAGSVGFCTGSPSSKYEHLRASALLRNIQNIRICMGKKPIVSVTYENERISIINSLPYLKCVLHLSCVVHGPIYGRFMGFYVNGFLSI